MQLLVFCSIVYSIPENLTKRIINSLENRLKVQTITQSLNELCNKTVWLRLWSVFFELNCDAMKNQWPIHFIDSMNEQLFKIHIYQINSCAHFHCLIGNCGLNHFKCMNAFFPCCRCCVCWPSSQSKRCRVLFIIEYLFN